MTTETETEYEAPKICTTTDLTLPSVLYADVVQYLGERTGETVEFQHAEGVGCDLWQGVGKRAGELTLCVDEIGWVMTGDNVLHPIRFTVVNEETPSLMGAGMIRNPAGGPHLHVTASVSA